MLDDETGEPVRQPAPVERKRRVLPPKGSAQRKAMALRGEIRE